MLFRAFGCRVVNIPSFKYSTRKHLCFWVLVRFFRLGGHGLIFRNLFLLGRSTCQFQNHFGCSFLPSFLPAFLPSIHITLVHKQRVIVFEYVWYDFRLGSLCTLKHIKSVVRLGASRYRNFTFRDGVKGKRVIFLGRSHLLSPRCNFI
jgi:hypothetical protein